ncbi:lysophospholipid transporter LplT [Methylophilus medardicus]|uniref:Lysophospholipid transporter LplT n=1 Tax=Methylophilus medardicus TaxID=2588534 RepID=A0A5B8CUP2_9PROT|nr:lysophospholipid transporter LplT [Methylophilus medardicus]QDC44969.1 lysophospholipid transporter LplT [Methylophilus medardicus]QDC49976.1 lysophospholipid transporter LplT [Methylophilus medardicus]QDC53681.1 lysophospholipid transporter LplT [Methylophilus medardicus]
MVKGFYTLLIAQFLSAIADNALLFAAIALLAKLNAPSWHEPLLREFFVISYIILAPFVGPFADALPKGRVMFLSNGLKFIGCLMALVGVPPLYAYAMVGVGAAAYSPAKYGILTEMLPSSLLIKANAWMEGTTVTAIILGPVLGSTLSANNPYTGIAFIMVLYLMAAGFNYYIPKVPIDHKVEQKNLQFLLKDFWHAFVTLWKDPQGQVSLAVTTLFWGAGATLQFVVLQWADVRLGFSQQQATYLIAILAVGIAAGSIIASRYVELENAVKVLPAGIYMGILVISMMLIHSPVLAGILLFVIGVLSGYFLVPLNSLLQHRGHHLLGAGHSIAVQNFNENIGILLLLGAYTWMVGAKLDINTIVAIFGVFIIVSMSLITILYRKQIQR